MNILCIAPHPDDEAIGCGGTLRHHVLKGDKVTVLFITSGEKGVHDEDVTAEDAQFEPFEITHAKQRVREREAGVCSQILGTHNNIFWRESDGGFDVWFDPEGYVNKLHTVVEVTNPHIIYAPHKDDNHPDHYGTSELVRVYCERKGTPCEIKRYEVWTPSSSDYLVLEDITDVVDIKRSAIRCYKSQLYNSLDEGILALNHYRGLMHGPNKMYCEAFS